MTPPDGGVTPHACTVPAPTSPPPTFPAFTVVFAVAHDGAAAESGDDQLHAWVLAREAMVPLNYGAPKAAAGLAERARHVAGHRPTAAAVLAAAVAARAYALNHQSEQARAALADADALLGRLPESERSETWLTYGEQKHHVHLSHAYITLGDTRLAHASQEHPAEHRRGDVFPSRRRHRAGVPPYGHRPDSTARRLPHRPGPPPRPGPVRGDPRSAPPRTRRPGGTGRTRRLTDGPRTAPRAGVTSTMGVRRAR
ncbi:hypothetical protein ACWGIA_38320 [Streptomyces bobili]